MIIADHWHDGPGPWVFLWFIAIVLFWATAILIVSRFWRRSPWGPRRPWDGRDARSAYDVLAERYARGEITETEYRERRAVLMEDTK